MSPLKKPFLTAKTAKSAKKTINLCVLRVLGGKTELVYGRESKTQKISALSAVD